MPYAEDFEFVEVEEDVPDYLPEEDQEEYRKRIAERKVKLEQERKARLDKEDEDAEEHH